jgi:hypothetical protein
VDEQAIKRLIESIPWPPAAEFRGPEHRDVDREAASAAERKLRAHLAEAFRSAAEAPDAPVLKIIAAVIHSTVNKSADARCPFWNQAEIETLPTYELRALIARAEMIPNALFRARLIDIG